MDEPKLATLTVAVVLVITVGLVAVALVRAWERAVRSRLARRRMARATAGEQKAITLLETHGYELLGAQVGTSYELVVDGARHDVKLRADYLVARDGRVYVAEVKTGELAPRIDTVATRRQLLEYGIAFDVDGVLLVDVEAARIREVSFPGTPWSNTRPQSSLLLKARAFARGGPSAPWLSWIVALVSLAAGTLVARYLT